MTDSNRILDPAEVEFLLDAGGKPGSEPAVASAEAAEPQAVTMRGDLDQINLSDIFQTLAMTKMEGVLRVSNPLEQRQVYCKAGYVRILVPPRVVKRRLGQLLVGAGLLAPDDLRKALLEQRKTGRPLGEVLVGSGLVSNEQVDELLGMQITEDLFALFTWRHGTFEFYKGPVEDAHLRAAFDACAEYEVNSLLLEIARRADEWESILASISSLEEVPQRLVDELPADKHLTEVHAAVFAATDARTSYRDHVEHTTFSLFDMARASRDLVDRGLIANVPDEALVAAAAVQCELGANKKALVLLQTLRERPGDRSLQTLQNSAQVLRGLGEARLAGSVLLEAAQLQTDPELALSLAREARDVSPRDPETISFLRTILIAHSPADSAELEQCTLELLDALLAEDRTSTALEIIADARATGSARPEILVREAKLLQKTRNPQRAAEILCELAEHYQSIGDRAKTIEAYQGALRLDRSRRDVQRLLTQLLRTRFGRAMRWVAAGVSAAMILAMGVVLWQQHRHDLALHAADAEITVLLEANDRAGARERLEHWRSALGEGDAVEDLTRRIEFADAAETGRQRRLQRQALTEQLDQAAFTLAKGDVDEACAIYAQAASDAQHRSEVAAVVDSRFDALAAALEKAALQLDAAPLPEPSAVLGRTALTSNLSRLRADCSAELVRAFTALNRMAKESRWPDLVTKERRALLAATLEKVGTPLRRAEALATSYEEALERNDHQRRLDPVFKAALAHEKAYEFDKALELYRRLEQEPASDDGQLRAHFRDQVARYGTITRLLGLLEAATAAGDFATAQKHYRALSLAFPDIPFGKLVRLPLVVDSSPTGATLSCNDKLVGTTPLLLTYLPADESNLKMEKPGFEPASRRLTGDAAGEWRPVLTLQPTARFEATAAVDVPVTRDEAGRSFFVDRAGVVTARNDAQEQRLWQYSSGDLSGLLSQAVVYEDLLLVASLDGDLRALTRHSGEVVFRIPQLPTERAPALLDRRLVVATTTGELCAVDIETKTVLRQKLRHRPASTLTVHGHDVIGIDEHGGVFAYRGADLEPLWYTALGRLPDANLAIVDGTVFVRDDRGSLFALDLQTGSTRWQRRFPHEILAGPIVVGDQVLLTSPGSILRVQRQSGDNLLAWPQGQASWTRGTQVAGNRLLAPSQDGFVQVLDTATGKLLYRLEGHRRGVSVFAIGDEVIVTTPDRLVMTYQKLP